MNELTSAPVPPLGPEDHVRGEGELLMVYADLACPHCAAAWAEIKARPNRVAFRHFPVASKHPRAPALHAAAEAAGRQGAFFAMVDSLYADPAHVDDPHLWRRVEELGPYQIHGDRDLMQALDGLLRAFVEQRRMKIAGEYKPCYEVVS